MSGPRHLKLPDELTELVKAQVRAEQHEPGFLGEDPDDDLPEVTSDEDALFADHDHTRGHGRGAYVYDAAEARTRSLDLSDTADPDRGPIPLPPRTGESAEELLFEKARPPADPQRSAAPLDEPDSTA